MPRETIRVQIDGAPQGEALSQLLAFVAYPEKLDAAERDRFARALWRMAILHKADADKSWANAPQKIKPIILLDDDKTFLASLKRGSKLLGRHMVTAYTFLLPHFIEQSTGHLPYLSEIDSRLERHRPTVENLSLAMKGFLGWEGPDIATFKDKVWRRAKPVAHLAYALATWNAVEMLLAQSSGRSTSDVFFNLFFDDTLAVHMHVAEECRKKAPSIKQFEIKEEQTIRFEAV